MRLLGQFRTIATSEPAQNGPMWAPFVPSSSAREGNATSRFQWLDGEGSALFEGPYRQPLQIDGGGGR
jgi:hypothetical protein